MRQRHGVVNYINSSLNAVGYALNALFDGALDLRIKGCAWGWACHKPLCKVLAVEAAHALGQPLCEMLPGAGVYYFPWEIDSSVPEGKTLRTFGRLCRYDLARSEAVLTTQHNLAQYQVCVDTKFVEPFQAQVGSFYMVLGEAEHREETSSPVVKARILTCVEGVNVPLLEQAIQEQRKYFSERQEQRENITS